MEMLKSNPHTELYEFLLTSPTPDDILAFRPSEATQSRIRDLLQASKQRDLTPEEQMVLDAFGKVEHLVRMLKIHARAKLNR